MLSDFLTLELYFGSPESALFFEDVSKKYSPAQIQKAVKKGDIVLKRLKFGPDKGRLVCLLSPQARFETHG